MTCAHSSQVETDSYQLSKSGVRFNIGTFPNTVISYCPNISPLFKGDFCIYLYLLQALYKLHLFPKVVHIVLHDPTQNEVRLLNE